MLLLGLLVATVAMVHLQDQQTSFLAVEATVDCASPGTTGSTSRPPPPTSPPPKTAATFTWGNIRASRRASRRAAGFSQHQQKAAAGDNIAIPSL
jgi:hypothetical protein